MTKFFKTTGFLEASSYLLLLGVAMPLKYLWERPEFVRWTGWFHGIFFILFCLAILGMLARYRWTFKLAFLAFLSAFFPFGPFVFERRYLNESNS